MQTITSRSGFLIVLMFIGGTTMAQTPQSDHKIEKVDNLKTYVIEREIPGAGNFSPEQLKAISQTSCGVLKEMGSQIQWLHSYVTGNKIYCIYKAASEELVREHARKGGFPANSVSEVSSIINPATAN